MLQRRLDNEADVIKDLKLIYKQASEDCAAKIAALSARTDMENIQSIIYQKQYQTALKKQIDGILELLQANEFEKIADYLGVCYENGFLESLYSLNKQGIPLIFPIDQEAVVKAVQTDSKISTDLYTRLGEDIKELKTSIRAEISRGISNGSSYNDIAKQIALGMNSPFKKAFNSAVRISRTEGNRIANQSAMDACYRARDKGAEVVKQWDSTLDGKTRPSHRKADGEIRELDEKFSNGLMYPGDSSGGAAEVVNCRCALLQSARWALEGGMTKMNNFTKEIEVFDSEQSYKDFKKNFFSTENVKYMNYVQTLEERYGTKDFKKVLASMTDREYNHYTKLLDENPVYKPKKPIAKTGNGGTMKADDVIIHKSVGAKSKNYDVELPNKEIVHLTEGTRVTNVEVIAGKGRNRQIDEIDSLVYTWGGSESEWQKKKGFGYVDYEGESYRAELHWYEEPTAGKHKWKVKPDADGNWFIED